MKRWLKVVITVFITIGTLNFKNSTKQDWKYLFNGSNLADGMTTGSLFVGKHTPFVAF